MQPWTAVPQGLTPYTIVVAHPYAPVPGFQKQILDYPICLCRDSECLGEERVPTRLVGLWQVFHNTSHQT